jgi:nucleotide-binding universal stress UspA family protein
MTAPHEVSRILVGVDFDDASAAALKMAEAIAGASDAAIIIFHAATLEVPAYFTGAQIVTLEAERDKSRAAIANRVRTFAAQHLSRAVTVEIGEGPPQDSILRVAASFDLIVVGTHRRHGPARWWLGSVAEAIVRQSARPVLVVPTGAVLHEPGRPLRILAAGGNAAAATDRWVDMFRTAFGATVARFQGIDQCTPDRLDDTDLIVLSMPAGSHSQLVATAQVLKECVHPVLFVPSADGIVERSSS